MDSPIKDQVQIDLTKSTDFLVAKHGFDKGGEEEEQRIPFFGSISKNRETTWVISLFVCIHMVVFFGTLMVNNCWNKSHGECVLLIFQPFGENPLLGPSPSVLEHMGALRRIFLANTHGLWRLFSSILLHAGAFHLIINLSSVIIVGINLEQKFGPLRTATIYLLSSLNGSLMAAIFVQNSPVVCSSGALFGLIGASFAGLLRDWKLYTKKLLAVAELMLFVIINLMLGFLPYVGNFSSLAGFWSGFLLGCILLFSPQLRKPSLHKGLFDYGVKKTVPLKQMLDKPILRTASLLLFSLMVCGLIVTALYGINGNRYCHWCQYFDCIPSRNWVCDIRAPSCKITESGGQTAVTCLGSDNYKILPKTGIPAARLEELCSLICS